MSKYWITPTGRFIIGYGADIPPQNATEVPIAPLEETDIWINGVWTRDPIVVKDRANAIINAKLLAEDLKIIRALVENDAVRIAAHKVAQTTLRGTLIP